MSNIKWKSGSFVRIHLGDGSYAYGRLREFPYASFYDYRSDTKISDLNLISEKPVLFSIAVHKSVLNEWEIIGYAPLEKSLQGLPVTFMQDLIDYKQCEIFNETGTGRTATPEECVGLEPSAVWEKNHVEERLLDAFMGRKNKYVESMKVRLK